MISAVPAFIWATERKKDKESISGATRDVQPGR